MNKTVRVIGGRAGCTLPFIIREAGEQYQQGHRVLVLVPEQFTLQCEQELMDRLKLPGFFDLEVLSPGRFRRRVREQAGSDGTAALNAAGRSMAMQRVLKESARELTYYGSCVDRLGLAESLLAEMDELAESRLKPDALQEVGESSGKTSVQCKMQDIARLWTGYDQILAGSFSDENAQDAETVRRLKASGLVQDTAVLVYGFDNLKPGFCAILSEIACHADSLTVTMIMQPREQKDGHIFEAQRTAATLLQQTLAERGIPCSLSYLEEEGMERAEPLAILEKRLFTRNHEPWDGETGEALRVHVSPNAFAEAAWAAQLLHEWHQDGIAWREMAVAFAGEVSPAFPETMRNAGVPIYLAEKERVRNHSLCRYLLSALHGAADGWRAEDMLEAARSGYSPLTADEADLLENYALENGIHGKKWTLPFRRGKQAEPMELLRLRFMEPMLLLHQGLKDAADIRAALTAVYDFLMGSGCYERLEQQEEMLLERGMEAEAARSRQVWKLVLDLLDQMDALLRGMKPSLKDMCRYLETGLDGACLSALPTRADVVQAGDAGHLMPGRIRALLLIGMQDGTLSISTESLLTPAEKLLLQQKNKHPVGMTEQEKMSLRLSDFYRTLTLPTERLALSWFSAAANGAAERPSSLLEDVKQLFPRLREEGGVLAETGRPLGPVPALETLSQLLRQARDSGTLKLTEEWQDALQYLAGHEEWQDALQQLLEALDRDIPAVGLDSSRARKIFGSSSVSISRLEKYASCPYQHFVSYGLKPVEQREYAFENDEKGSFLHEVMQRFSTKVVQMPDWTGLEEEEIDQMVDEILPELVAEWEHGPLTEDGFGRTQGRAIIRSAKRAARQYVRHARVTDFHQKGAEIKFGQDAELPPLILNLQDGHRIALRGTIDRLDEAVVHGEKYVRVVDYKSSDKTLDWDRMYRGEQLQLPLYLKAAEEGTRAFPAAAQYFVMKDPVVPEATDDKEKADKKISQELRLKGIVISDADVVEALDRKHGESMPYPLNKDGGISSKSSAMLPEEMKELLDHSQRKAEELAWEIRNGRLSVSPEEGACTYCDYAAICGRDPAYLKEKTSETMNREKFFQRIREDRQGETKEKG